MTTIDATILADSVNPKGSRLTTFLLHYPRPFLAEINTHRAFSRNAASSRAVPTKKMIERVEKDPYIPITFHADSRGMQARSPLTEALEEEARALWGDARDNALAYTRHLDKIGVHKSYMNRLLEPFMHIDQIVTTAEPGLRNFFKQRLAVDEDGIPLAQPEVYALATVMLDAYEQSEPTPLRWGGWHIPYSDWKGEDNDAVAWFKLSREDQRRIAVARCARVSYFNHDGAISHEDDFALFKRLKAQEHWSPFEHSAEASEDPRADGRNFGAGWWQYRAMVGG